MLSITPKSEIKSVKTLLNNYRLEAFVAAGFIEKTRRLKPAATKGWRIIQQCHQ
jgi:hypothetical protein